MCRSCKIYGLGPYCSSLVHRGPCLLLGILFSHSTYPKSQCRLSYFIGSSRLDNQAIVRYVILVTENPFHFTTGLDNRVIDTVLQPRTVPSLTVKSGPSTSLRRLLPLGEGLRSTAAVGV